MHFIYLEELKPLSGLMMNTTYHILRHAEADYSKPSEGKTKGWELDLAPLSKTGRKQVSKIVADVEKISPEMIITSPTTRTMETTLILLQHLDAKFRVEFDLHEWIPGFDFEWKNLDDIYHNEKKFESYDGEHQGDDVKNWESLSMIRKRVTTVLDNYSDYSTVLIVCHEKVIRAMTGQVGVASCETIQL